MKKIQSFSATLLILGLLATESLSSGNVQGPNIEVILNPKTPVPLLGKRKRIVFEEELTIGTGEGDENYMFGEDVRVIADDEECLYVLDWDRKRIQKFDPKGEYLLTIGRRGQGPGEFGNIRGLNFDGEGNFYATDTNNKRITFFSRDGAFVRDITIPGDILLAVTLLSDGNYLTSRWEAVEEAGVSMAVTIFGVYDQEFNLVAEIHRETRESRPRGNRSRAEFIADIVSRGAFKPTYTKYVTKDGLIYAGYPTDYEIRIYNQKGEALRAISREYDPIKVSQHHKDDYFNQEVMYILRVSSPAGPEVGIKNDVKRFMRYPKYLPAYRWFTLMENGWLFVVVDALEGEAAEIDLFDESGTYIGRFDTHIPMDSLHFKNGKAYAVATIDGYNYVKRYAYKVQEY